MATNRLGERTIRHQGPRRDTAAERLTPANGLDLRVLTKLDEVLTLRPAWDALWRRADGNYAQSPATCLAAWQQIAAHQARLHVVACFEAGDLVAIWPLVRRRQALWRVLYQLGAQAAEFSEMLLDGGPRRQAWAAAIWHCVRARSGADMIMLPFVKIAQPLGALLAPHDFVANARPDVAPYVAWQPGDTWAQYYGSLSASWRKVQNKKRRHLEGLGALRFEIVRDPERLPALIEWLMREKRIWAGRAGKRGPWLTSPQYESFLRQLGGERAVGAGFVFLLTLDGAPVAAQFAIEGERHIDWIIAGFSAALAGHSPGMVLNEHCLRYALDAGLRVEMGAGREANKLLWSRGTAHATLDYRIALTRFGVPGLALSNARIAAFDWIAKRAARRATEVPKP